MIHAFTYWTTLVVCALLLLQIDARVDAADAPAPMGNIPSSSVHKDGIAFDIQISKDTLIPYQLVGTLVVSNTDSQRKLSISSMSIELGGRMHGIYKSLAIKTDQFDLEPGTSRTFAITFDLAAGRPTIPEHAVIRSGESDFLVSAVYRFNNDGIEPRSNKFLVKSSLKTTNVYVVAGGFFGALLLIMFTIASKILALARTNQVLSIFADRKSFFLRILKWSTIGFAYAANGFIVALLIVLLSVGLNEFQLPIAFKLEDFSGGLIVGLFSVTLGKFLAEKLSL